MSSMTDSDSSILRGTTLRVYRYLFRTGRPASIRDVQRGLGLSSPSVAEYHLRKLLQSGLVREGKEGYEVDRMVWQNMIRMRRRVIPFQAVYSLFFATALVVMVIVFRNLTAQGYLFGLAVIVVGLGLSLYEATKALRQAV